MRAQTTPSIREQEDPIRPLLDRLARGECEHAAHWRDWHVRRIEGGWCNLLYRVTGPAADLAVKFTMRDQRDRAGREHSALCAMQQASPGAAPLPLLLDRTSYAQPVVVSTWLEGRVSPTPPATDAEWRSLLQHLTVVHSVTPGYTRAQLPAAVVNASDAQEGRESVRQQLAHVPPHARPASLQALVRRFEARPFPTWRERRVALCRADSNILNFVRRPGTWASVDWENSGWGDPAFDVANLMTHAAYVDVPSWRWNWVRDAYCELAADDAAALRIRTYYAILLAWWVARIARYLYEIPRGLDERLVPWPEGWEANMRSKYEHYLRLAQEREEEGK